MESSIDMERVERNVLRDSQQDGLMELVMGLCFVGFSMRALHPVFVGMFAVGPLVFRPILLAMRRRFTFPRIGYVNLVEDNPREVLGGIATVFLILIAVLVVGFVLFGDIGDFDLWLKWTPVFPGTLLAAMFLSFATKSKLARYWVLAVVSASSGLGLSLLRFEPPETGLFIYCLVMGVALIGLGFGAFVRFLRRHPLPAEEMSDANG